MKLLSIVKFTLVDNADCLALASLNRLGCDEVNLRVDAEHRLDRLGEGSFHNCKIADGIRELLGVKFNVNVKGIVVLDAVDLDEVVGGIAFLDENGFYL